MQGRPFSAAVVCANPPSRSAVIDAIEKTDVCITPGVQCQVWRQGKLIEDASHALDQGTTLQVHIHRQTLHSWDAHEEESDENAYMQQGHVLHVSGHTMLQTQRHMTHHYECFEEDDLALRLARFSEHLSMLKSALQDSRSRQKQKVLCLDGLIPSPRRTAIDCAKPLFLRQQCLQIDLGQWHSNNAVVKWHPVTLAAFETMVAWTNEPPIKISFFTDGSAAHVDGVRQGASAVVLLVHTLHDTLFGGFRCFSLFEGASAPRAEMAAILGALLWASQILEEHSQTIQDSCCWFACCWPMADPCTC